MLSIKSGSERNDEKQDTFRRIPYPSSLLERCCRQMGEDVPAPGSFVSSSSSENRLRQPHFVLRMEKLLFDFLSDQTKELKTFASLHPDCITTGAECVYLPKFSREERFIIFAMLPHYNLRGETDTKRDGKVEIMLIFL